MSSKAKEWTSTIGWAALIFAPWWMPSSVGTDWGSAAWVLVVIVIERNNRASGIQRGSRD